MFQFMLVLLGAVCADSPSEESQLTRLARERDSIHSGELRLELEFKSCGPYAPLAGATWKPHYWFRSDRSAFRYDLWKSVDQNGGGTTESRFAFDGEVYRVIDVVGNPRHATREFVGMKPEAVTELFDPRVIGLQLESFLALHNSTLEDVVRIAANAETFRAEQTAEGLVETYGHKGGATYRYVFDRRGLPVRFEAINPKLATEIRYVAEIGYGSDDSERMVFPQRIDFQRFEAGTLVTHEIWNIALTKVNEPIDLALCTWKSLEPVEGTPLVRDNDNSKLAGVWNGVRYEPENPRFPQMNMELNLGKDGGGPPWVMMALAGILLAAMVAVLMRRIAVGRHT